MAIGVSGTTDYQSRGITQSDSEPAIQGYVEPSYGLGPVLGDAFVNIWSSSSVDFGTGQGAEIDVAGGIKPKFLGPKWSPNIGYVHYFYAPENVSPDYGEIYAKTDYTFGTDDKFTLRGSFSSLPTTTKAALPAPRSQEVGGSSCGRTSGSTPAPAISSSKILMHSNSWSGLPAFPTIGNHSPSTSAIGTPISATTNACSQRI